ncbi:MAG: hypothetical protein H6745_12500 [Deltaproteobacteria bacterium]|nr:hypothetical protein [Deltaproteobacteria bacterium]
MRPLDTALVLAAALLLFALPAAGGCAGDAFQGDIPACRCDVELCTSASCGYELRLDPGCNGQIAKAEVLIDGHLESDILSPGISVIPCTRTEPGVESQIIVRGGDWVWGPLVERCTDPGETRLLVLQCIEATQ